MNRRDSIRSASGLLFLAASWPGSTDAQGADWPSFLGPSRDGHVVDASLDLSFGEGGPRLLWSFERGQGFSSPSVVGERVVYTHRAGNEAVVVCLDAKDGSELWSHRYPCEYSGRYIDDAGPRSTPTIVGDWVYVHGVEGVLNAFDLATGEVRWTRDTEREFEIGDDFFGVVSTPLVVGDLLIQNVGAPGGPTVVALDRRTGKTVWEAGEEWGPSCASPVLATMHGKQRVLCLAGGKSRPPTGGLMVIDLATGDVEGTYPYRSRTFESVNAATPVVDGNRVYLSASYGVGSACVEVREDGSVREVWTNERLGLQFSTPVFEDGVLYAVDGVSGRAGSLVAVDPDNGRELWREDLSFDETVEDGGETKEFTFSVGEGSLIVVGERLVLLGDFGHLVVLRPHSKGAEVVAHAPLFHAPESWTPPVIANGRLYICQNRRGRFGATPARLLCYDLR